MSPDRRKMLRSMIAAMAATGLTASERRSAFAKVEPFALRVGSPLATAVNPYLGDTPTPTTAGTSAIKPAMSGIKDAQQKFKKKFGAGKRTYAFGDWVNDNEDDLGKPLDALKKATGLDPGDYQKALADIDPGVKAALTAAINAWMTGDPTGDPQMMYFDVYLSLTGYSELQITTTTQPSTFNGKTGMHIQFGCKSLT